MKKNIFTFNTISEFHQISGFSKPLHPLVSVVDYGKVNYQTDKDEIGWVQNFYTIGLKKNIQGKFKYGQQSYDFDEGLLSFVSPGQVVQITIDKTLERPTGWLLLIHPDFIWNTSLANKINQYDFFGYAVNEALFMSENEELIITDIMKQIEKEYHNNIDHFSQSIIITQIELLLHYSDRFYQRQFITRKKSNHQLLDKFEQLLENYFQEDHLIENGLPSVNYFSSQLHLSSNYLGSLLKTLTGMNTQQHIHQKLINEAKRKLSTSNLSVSEIAYELGFEHPQSFSKFFKSKTNLSPLEFRESFS